MAKPNIDIVVQTIARSDHMEYTITATFPILKEDVPEVTSRLADAVMRFSTAEAIPTKTVVRPAGWVETP